MSYLDQILKSTSATADRTSKRKSSINEILSSIDTPAPAAAPAAPTGGGQHAMSDGHGHQSAAEVKGLNAQFNSSLQRLIADSGGKVTVGSGYRSYQQQAKLYADYLAGKPGQAKAAPPGKSNHNHGLAADLKYASPEARAWVHANAAKYGLRFPMSYEPWHIEPVNAKAMRGK